VRFPTAPPPPKLPPFRRIVRSSTGRPTEQAVGEVVNKGSTDRCRRRCLGRDGDVYGHLDEVIIIVGPCRLPHSVDLIPARMFGDSVILLRRRSGTARRGGCVSAAGSRSLRPDRRRHGFDRFVRFLSTMKCPYSIGMNVYLVSLRRPCLLVPLNERSRPLS
jgi:hypothetical protein